jgi:hypothetical protein
VIGCRGVTEGGCSAADSRSQLLRKHRRQKFSPKAQITPRAGADHLKCLSLDLQPPARSLSCSQQRFAAVTMRV